MRPLARAEVILLVLPLSGLVALGACGGGDSFVGVTSPPDASVDVVAPADGDVPDALGQPDAGADVAEGDAAGSRGFALAVTGAQIVITGPSTGLQLAPANVTEDADVVAVHQEFYGVPWDAFLAKTAPPPEWVSVMQGFAKQAKDAGKPVFLSLSMLDGTRRTLAPKTVITNGQVKAQEKWAAACYDFATATDRKELAAAYLAYVGWMVGTFSPAYLNVAVEVNLFFESCPGSRAGVAAVINAAYDTAKAAQPSVLAFPSFELGHLYGYADSSCSDPKDPVKRAACYEANYALLAGIKRDRFAMSTYPYLQHVVTVADIPPDWLTRAAARGKERPIVSETGWLSTGLTTRGATGPCYAVFDENEAEAQKYLDFVAKSATAGDMDLVTWWADRDLVDARLMTDCPCAFDATWCAVLDAFRGPMPDGGPDTQLLGDLSLKAFGTMGLRAYDGTPKSQLYARWQSVRAQPLRR